MGSPVSPILTNLVMEDIENKAMTEFHHPSKIWKRYVYNLFYLYCYFILLYLFSLIYCASST